MRNVAAKVLAGDDVPSWPVASVELLLDLCSDVFLDVVLPKRGCRDIDSVLLHLLAHINVLDDRLRNWPILIRRCLYRGGGCRADFLGHDQVGVRRVVAENFWGGCGTRRKQERFSGTAK